MTEILIESSAAISYFLKIFNFLTLINIKTCQIIPGIFIVALQKLCSYIEQLLGFISKTDILITFNYCPFR